MQKRRGPAWELCWKRSVIGAQGGHDISRVRNFVSSRKKNPGPQSAVAHGTVPTRLVLTGGPKAGTQSRAPPSLTGEWAISSTINRARRAGYATSLHLGGLQSVQGNTGPLTGPVRNHNPRLPIGIECTKKDIRCQGDASKRDFTAGSTTPSTCWSTGTSVRRRKIRRKKKWSCGHRAHK